MKFSSYLIGLLNIVALLQRHKLEKCFIVSNILFTKKKKARRLRPKGGAVCAILDHFCFVGSQKDLGMRKRWVRCLEKSKMVLSFLFSTVVTKFLSEKFKLSQPINFSLSLFCISLTARASGNSTTFLKVEIVSYDWNFVNLSWNAIETGNSHVTYRVTARRGNKAIDLVTPKKSMALSSLKQLTRYEIKVQALENNSVPLASAAVSFITGGEFALA